MRLATAVSIACAVLAGCGDNITGSSSKAVTEFEFVTALNPQLSGDISATITGSAIAAVVPFGTDVRHLVATFDTTGTAVDIAGTAQHSGVTANDFTAPVTYSVTAADLTTTTFTVTVTVAAADAKQLTEFAFLAANNPGLASDIHGAIAGTDVDLTVPFGTDAQHLVAMFTTTGTSVTVGGSAQASGTTANDFTSPVTYTVTAGDGTVVEYTVAVTIGLSTADDITAYAFLAADNPALAANVGGGIADVTVTATVPFETDVTHLIATFTMTGTGIAIAGTPQVSGVTVNDFTAPQTYIVNAADGSSHIYAVTVKIADDPSKTITSFAFLTAHNPTLSADVTATISAGAISATVPHGISVTDLVATFTTTGALVSIAGVPEVSGVTANDFTTPLDYTVTAADNTLQDYIVTVTVAP